MAKTKPVLKDNARIGIVNRGEAAVRFIRAVRDFNRFAGTGLETVAFYTDRERDALFVQEADSAYPLSSFRRFSEGKGSPYLDKVLIMEALSGTGCKAVWVGWGFVSEDAEFAAMVEKARLVFLGPSSSAMAMLGDKIAAKELAESSGVPICPWSKGPVESAEAARRFAEKIGYPVIIKAANAGGGRGIRFVLSPEDLAAQYKSAVEETKRITGNTIVFIERLVEKGRHLEVQVLADRHGCVKTFGVRDCSIQRKNQKIVEETPPPAMDAATVKAMEEAAGRLIKAAAYESAGTVEFLYDLDRNEFYFMEVNTRLQVEHPITEQLFGVDLIRGQILVARGAGIESWNPEPRGAVVEVRLNAEDPNRDFRPSPGRVVRFRAPAGPGIRVDSGIEQGSEIPADFDSMVAKIIASGPDRKTALARLERALTEMRIKIEGGTTNRAFLLGLLGNEGVRAGGVHTRFVEELLASGSSVVERKDWAAALTAAAIEQYLQRYGEEFANFSQQMFTSGSPRDLRPSMGHEAKVTAQGRPYEFLVRSLGGDFYRLSIGDVSFSVRYSRKGEDAVLLAGALRHHVQIVERGDAVQVEVNGVPYEVGTESGGVVKAPSPALVLSVPIAPGTEVEKGDVLLTLEAMKMEMILPAPEKGIVREIRVKAGEQVGAGQPLVVMETGGKKAAAAPAQKAGKSEPVSFSAFAGKRPDEEWESLRREYLAVFAGYDTRKNTAELFEAVDSFASVHPEYFPAYIWTVVEGLDLYASVEGLFSSRRIEVEGVARPAASSEFLAHYFKRTVDREKGLPERFLKSLERVFRHYSASVGGNADEVRHVLFRIFKSRAAGPGKQALLIASLSSAGKLSVSRAVGRRIQDLLDETALLAQVQQPALADAAINARYRLFDRDILNAIREEKQASVVRILDLAVRAMKRGKSPDTLTARIVEMGHDVAPELARLAMNDRGRLGVLALEALARRMSRDRKAESVSVEGREGRRFACVRCGGVLSVVAVTDEKDLADRLAEIGGLSASAEEREILLFVFASSGEVPDKRIETVLKGFRAKTATICVGVVDRTGSVSYRTWTSQGGRRWTLDGGRMGFHPLAYRELRIGRLSEFETKLLYSGEGVYLVHGVARSNPKDERLFALGELTTLRPEFAEDGSIGRMVAFENLFMEAVYAIRAEQIKRKHRLHWNRIIIHMRPVFTAPLDLIQDYAARLAVRTRDLGVERFVLYCPFQDPVTKRTEEKELLFDNIVGTSFSLSTREPSSLPMQPMDSYVARVVRARQRGTFYPYEVVKMLTTPGGKDSLPPGEFEEFDLAEIPLLADGTKSRMNRDEEVREAEAPGSAVLAKSYRSVKGRPYGGNEGNVVFGVIENRLPGGLRVKRVIVLSDPTTDLGSLAEPECRRVNAAFDLAEDLGVPVEWLPVSGGARIDMDSGTENLDWTASTLRRIIRFTQKGGEINIIVAGTNVGAQSYWNAESTMLMHTRGLLVMTEDAAMILTGKKALDFSGSVSAEDNVGIGGVAKIMEPNGQAQVRVRNLTEAYEVLFTHYALTYVEPGRLFPAPVPTEDPRDRDVGASSYRDFLGQGFETVGDIFGRKLNPERKKPFDIRQVMQALVDRDLPSLERWGGMRDAETAVVWETRIGGHAAALIGVESRSLPRQGEVPYDGPESWSGGTLFPLSSKKVARGINAASGRLPLVILANLSGFDGSPESLRKLQLEFGAEIGRAVVNFRGTLVFVDIARYHGGAYVVFSKHLNPGLHSVALEGSFASVIGGAPAAAVVFPSQVLKDTYKDAEVVAAQERRKTDPSFTQKDFDEVFKRVHAEKQTALAAKFDRIHSVERARKVGSIDAIISVRDLRRYVIDRIEIGAGER